MSDLKTSFDFQTGYDAASKAKQVIMDAQEAEIARLQIVIKDQRAQLDSLGDRFDAQSDEIARLQADLNGKIRAYGEASDEVERLLDVNEKLRAAIEGEQDVWDIVDAKNDKIQRLRAALEEIVALSTGTVRRVLKEGEFPIPTSISLTKAETIARAALAKEEGK